eukprot:GHVU01217273.1.p1 GENE.GHVU01217273.1~~GHVU01217273.1.p1  ORF type:complete len:205 (+),score=55.57 GHVU01217273.1:27-617(+)
MAQTNKADEQSPVSVHFCTSNAGKLKEFRQILDGYALVESTDVDLPELQGEMEDICRQKCRLAFAAVKGPVVVEDTSLCFDAWNGLPGPYVKWFLQKLGVHALPRLLDGFEEKGAAAVCLLGYYDGSGEGEPVVLRGETKGTIVEARGSTNFGWDAVFQPRGRTKTYGEMEAHEKNAESHRRRALDKLKEHLRDQA